MTSMKRPGALASHRAGNGVLAGTLFHTTTAATPQRHRRNPPPRLIGWRVSRWLTVEAVEVR